MEVDEIQRQVCKFQRVSSNGSTTTTDNSSNPPKIASNRGNLELQNHVDDGGGGGGGGDGGGGIDVVVGGGAVGRLCGWPSSRIVRVSRASGGKDRHSKVLTSKGLRDRRVRLSVSTAIQFYDLQDRLGYDQPSKAVEWLLKAASSSIDELPPLDPSFPGAIAHHHHHQVTEEKKSTGYSKDFEDPNYQQQNSNNNASQVKSPACSSTSETSKGSGLSLSRSENRIKARERAREMVSKREKEKGSDSTRAVVLNQVSNISENSSFTDLLTGGINSTATVRRTSPESRTNWTAPMDYFFTRPPQPSTQLIQIPQFNITAGDHHQHQHQHHHNHNPQHHFSFLQDSFVPAVTTTTGGGSGGGESYSLNFAMTSSSTGGAAVAPVFSRGTLQSNLPSSILSHHHHHLQRFQSSSIDGSATNLPFFIVPNTASDHFPSTGSYHLSYGGGDGGGRHTDHHKEKTKN